MGDEITVNRKWALSVLSLNGTELRAMASVRDALGKYKRNHAITIPVSLLHDVRGQFGTYTAEVDEAGLRGILGDLVDELVDIFEAQPALEEWETISLDNDPTGLINREALNDEQVRVLASLEAKELHEISMDTLHVASKRLGVGYETLSMHLALAAAEREDVELVYAKSAETKAIKPPVLRKPLSATVTKKNLANIQNISKQLDGLANTGVVAACANVSRN